MPASQIYQASLTLNNAQILALPTTPAVIVPPTEVLNYEGTPNQLFMPILGVSRTVIHAVDYTNINAACIFGFDIGSDDSFTYSVRITGGTEVLNSTGGVSFFSPMTLSGGEVGVRNMAFGNNLSDSLLDNAIVFFAFNQGDGDFTGGDPTNEIKLTVSYLAINI